MPPMPLSMYQPHWYKSTPGSSKESRACFAVLLSVFFVGVAVFGLALATWLPLLQHGTNDPLVQAAASRTIIRDCGSTAIEARKRGCRFDPISFSWLSPECYDSELVDSFLAMNRWAWYTSKADSPRHTVAMPYRIVALGEQDHLWVTREFHIHHCTFQWKKMHRAILGGKPIDGYIGNYSHTEHCEHVLVEPETRRSSVDVRIQRKFTTCGLIDTRPIY